MSQPWIEPDCTFVHAGKAYTSGGAVITDQYVIGYPSDLIQHDRSNIGWRALLDWHGNEIGLCYFTAAWPVKSYIGSHMRQIKAIVNGIHYTGGGFGKGMICRLRRCAKQTKA
jgi:hypothetical protein